MVKRQLIATGAIALALALTACSQPAPSPATSESAATTGASMAVSANEAETLMGVWNMTSLEAGADGSLANVPYSGQIAFDSESVSVQAMNPDTAAPDTAYTVRDTRRSSGTSLSTRKQAPGQSTSHLPSLGTSSGRRYDIPTALCPHPRRRVRGMAGDLRTRLGLTVLGATPRHRLEPRPRGLRLVRPFDEAGSRTCRALLDVGHTPPRTGTRSHETNPTPGLTRSHHNRRTSGGMWSQRVPLASPELHQSVHLADSFATVDSGELA